MNQTAAGWGALFLMVGCASRNIELGTGDAGDTNVTRGTLPPPSHGPDSPPLEEWPDPDACVAESNLPLLVGKWNGYIGRWQNAVADFQIDIRGASDLGGICGTVTFKPGSTPPPPPTDAESLYPPGWETYSFAGTSVPPGIVNGFVHTIISGRAQAGRATLTIAVSEPWEPWCRLQSPYLDTTPTDAGRDQYGCLPAWDRYGSVSSCYLINPVTNEWAPVSCGKAQLCASKVCQCNAARCVAKQAGDSAFDKTFDLTFSGTEATGTVNGIYPNGDILLTRAP